MYPDRRQCIQNEINGYEWWRRMMWSDHWDNGIDHCKWRQILTALINQFGLLIFCNIRNMKSESATVAPKPSWAGLSFSLQYGLTQRKSDSYVKNVPSRSPQVLKVFICSAVVRSIVPRVGGTHLNIQKPSREFLTNANHPIFYKLTPFRLRCSQAYIWGSLTF